MFANETVELKGAVPYEAFLTAIAGGEPPDGASNIQYIDYMARDVLQPLEDFVSTSTILKKDEFVEGNWNQGFFNGVQLGIPGIECFLQYGLDYNTKMIEEAGLDPNSPPETWDDIAVWNDKLTKFDSAGNLLQIGLDPYDAMAGGLWDTSAFFVPLSWGWDWWDSNTKEFDLDNEKMVEGLKTMSDLVKKMGVDKLAGLHAVEGQGQWGDSFNAEVQAMLIEGYWHPGETQAAKPEVAQYNRASWIPVPASRKGSKCQGTGGHLVVLFKMQEFCRDVL
jgi:maltose-binding protein MalE